MYSIYIISVHRPMFLNCRRKDKRSLTPNLLTTTIVAPPSSASKWQMGFNSAFKGLMKQQKTFAEISLPVIISWMYFSFIVWYGGLHAMTRLVEVLCYKLRVVGSISDGIVRIFHWLLPAALWPCCRLSLGGKGGQCVGQTTIPPSFADWLEIWEL